MAIKILQIELLENHLFVELEAEDTMSFGTILGKLKSESHLKAEGTYYIKTPSGMPVKESSAISIFRQNSFVITENSDWKLSAVKKGNLAEVTEVNGEMVFSDNKYWVLSFLNGAFWQNDELQSQLLSLNNISTPGGKKMSMNMAVQYVLTDTTLSSNKHCMERTAKVKKILEDALNIELAVNNINEANFYAHTEKLNGRMEYYLKAHMEMHWGTRIDSVCIVGFREFTGA